ncbi:MAG: FG-GAP repeat domain-containing protein [Candidatus Binatia bacterium]
MNNRRYLWVYLMVICGMALACNGEKPQGTQKEGLTTAADGLPSDAQWRQDFTFADMDNDGELDLVTAPPRKNKQPWPHIFFHRNDRWEPISCPEVGQNGFPQKEYVYGGVTVADFTGDGKQEIVIAMHEVGLRMFVNQGASPCGPWVEQDGFPATIQNFRSRAITHADMNRDGRIDIVALSEAPQMNSDAKTAGLGVFLNEESGWSFQSIAGSEGLFGDDLAVGEVNGDGVPDIAVGSLNDIRPQFVWLSDGNGQWKDAGAEGLPNNIIAWTVQLTDFDNDGKDELVLGVGGAPMYENGGPRIYRWDGSQWHTLSEGLPQVFWVSGVTAVDLDNDGKKEIIAAGMYTGTVRLYRQTAEGTWSEHQEIKVAEESDKLRNYKVRSFSRKAKPQNVIVANYAGEHGGKIAAWVWR